MANRPKGLESDSTQCGAVLRLWSWLRRVRGANCTGYMEAVEAAASAYAKANGSDNFKIEQLLIPEHRRCACACCGHQHCVTRRPGFYFNGKSLQDLLIDEAKKAELATT